MAASPTASRSPARSAERSPPLPRATSATPANVSAAANQKRVDSRSRPTADEISAVNDRRRPEDQRDRGRRRQLQRVDERDLVQEERGSPPRRAARATAGRRAANDRSSAKVERREHSVAEAVPDRRVRERQEAVRQHVARDGDVERPEQDGRRAASGRPSPPSHRRPDPIGRSRLARQPCPIELLVPVAGVPAAPAHPHGLLITLSRCRRTRATSTRSSARRRRTSRTRCAPASRSSSQGLPATTRSGSYAEAQMERLERLGYASSKAEDGCREPRDRPGWDEIPSSAPGRSQAAAAPTMSVDGGAVLVTGGSRGIGRAIALRFARARRRTGRDRLPAKRPRGRGDGRGAPRARRRAGARPRQRRLGAGARARCARSARSTALVHNAATGVSGRRSRPRTSTGTGRCRRTPARSSRSTRVAAPPMPEGSSIVAISSLGSTRVLENYVLVGTSKAALEALVRYLAVELAPRGIRVNAVSGGVVETGALDHFPPRRDARMGASEPPPAGWSSPRTSPARSPSSARRRRDVRGQTLVVDGGFSLPA